MAKPVQIINDYWLKETILNGNPDLNKFYKEDLIRMVNVLKSKNQELKNQQKEFINFLNNMIIAYKRAEKEYGNVADRAFWIAFETALSKYKEIIGDKYE